MSRKIAAIIFVLAMSLLLMGCSKQVDTSPQLIDSSLDICPTCNMSIIDLHYAAEIVTQEGQAEKFDDIGCLVLYLKKHSQEPALKESVVYVKDYNTMDWIIASEATYIKAHINTPMNFGIVGFGSQEAAQLFGGELEDATLMNWQEVLSAKQTVSF
ncbi:nitrous oxide reductase accessory protein NosL [Desulfosporosinus nitroreducens]|uniref:Nitrous oxide reductase accessory protein NosL n=1 Tax=Desulfosporosinus nitroreducens TaxID=2018668 RepID=A0ABT8QPX2_9FIRM|nr:nitrous oxide reductase accessory protein NosL [Desulfosporosinus nitroreducens]MCO1601797.1 nitrous oxide reductase accessory protein NosL [Desulfosporosinus nitroreducens]MDO0823340.1 nitrous oxide reductase accessory protein NosL [Desulfosporosinus nitroreducens]